MAAIMNDEILLESGTNEIEIMEFTIDGVLYGINVAKVTEIMISAPVKFMPHTHMAVEGIFKPRDAVITVINLPKYLGVEECEPKEKDLFIVTGFNKMTLAFRVHTVVGINRISWTEIQKPDKTISGGDDGVATGIAQCGGDLVTILDFEKIVAEIAPETSIQISEIDEMGPRERNLQPIYIAEDSILLSRMIRDALTNIEMPQMDGHRLTKLVKDDPELKHIPVIIFSSLISEEMRIKGEELGANEQLTKPEIGRLVSVMDGLLQEKAAQGETA